MKKLLMPVAIFCTLFMLMLPVSADTEAGPAFTGEIISREIILLDNGYYYEDVITIDEEPMATMGAMATATIYQKSGSKTRTAYNGDGDPMFSLTVHGTFQYDKVSYSSCVGHSYSHTIYVSSWRLTSGSSWAVGNTATAEGTFKRKFLFIDVETAVLNISLACSPAGALL